MIKEAVEECDFVAFDCEMTGLFLENNEGSYLDDMALRYYKVRLPIVVTPPSVHLSNQSYV